MHPIMFICIIMLLILVMSGCAEAAPLLASGNTVTGYVAIIVTFAALVALGIFFGKRDRAKIKADLIPKVEPKKVSGPKPTYRIKEFRVKTEKGVVSVFKVQRYVVEYDNMSTFRYWVDLSDEFTHLAGAEAWLVKHLEVIRQLNVPTLSHEYTDKGDPIPPAPALYFPDNRPATLGDA